MPTRPSVRCPDCKALHVGTGRCAPCSRRLDRQRGTRQQRGYDAAHDRLRADYQRRMNAGEVFACWRCQEAGRPHLVDPTDWHLGHDDDDRTIYRGPECPAGNLGRGRRGGG